MVLNIQAILPQARTLLNSTLPDSSVNSRTGLTVPCRVDDSGRNMRYHGLPMFIQFPIWDITLPDDTDMKAGDILTVTRAADSSVETYFVTVVRNPTTYSVSTDVETVQAFGGNGNGTIPVPPNCTVTFTHRALEISVVADAYVHPIGDDVTTADGTPAYMWQVLFDPTLTYPGGKLPSQNDIITCSVLGTTPDGLAKTSTISHPRRSIGIMPVALASFSESP